MVIKTPLGLRRDAGKRARARGHDVVVDGDTIYCLKGYCYGLLTLGPHLIGMDIWWAGLSMVARKCPESPRG